MNKIRETRSTIIVTGVHDVLPMISNDSFNRKRAVFFYRVFHDNDRIYS